MAGTAAAPTSKYVVVAKYEVSGVVEKPDVIGAIFGQTEGIFGPELDLRELQKNNRIGRIEVDAKSNQNRTLGSITLTSSLDKPSTAIIAAAVESIDRVGPCEARVYIEKIEDTREVKRKQIVRRAKELLKKWTVESSPEIDELVKEVTEALKPSDVSHYGPEQLPSGPDITSSTAIIVVEGRADVINLLRCGIRNVIATEGARVPDTVTRLSREKEVTVFLDGDRAGDLIFKELSNSVEIKYVARAPPGKEVEDLTCREILSVLKEKAPFADVKMKHARVTVPPPILEAVGKLRGSLEAIFFNERNELLTKIPVNELTEKLGGIQDINTIVFDGIITQRLVDAASEKAVKYVIGDRISDVVKRPPNIRLMTFGEVAPETPVSRQ